MSSKASAENWQALVLEKDKNGIERVNRIPYEIVEIFERHGFIWGGRWYHFDTMHFEYRPELLPQQAQPTVAPAASSPK